MPHQMYATALWHHGRVRPLQGAFLCAVRKRQDEVIYVLAGTGFVKMNGCDRRTGAGLKSSVVGSGAGVCGENPRRNL